MIQPNQGILYKMCDYSSLEGISDKYSIRFKFPKGGGVTFREFNETEQMKDAVRKSYTGSDENFKSGLEAIVKQNYVYLGKTKPSQEIFDFVSQHSEVIRIQDYGSGGFSLLTCTDPEF